MPILEAFSVSLNLGLLNIEGTWKPDDIEKKAAWEMYVELVTRVTLQELTPEEGLLREALSSFYSLFGTTREILRRSGPSIAKPKNGSNISFGQLAVNILNFVLRPLLAIWHPLLLDYEQTREKSVSLVEHERRWEKNKELQKEIAEVRVKLIKYADLLANVAGVQALHTPSSCSK